MRADVGNVHALFPQSSAAENRWVSTLSDQARLEYARAVYGLNDRARGRLETAVAVAVRRAEERGEVVTKERAEQRARAYLPVVGHEHCPRCWVLGGVKHLLHMTLRQDAADLQTARCPDCGAEYVSEP